MSTADTVKRTSPVLIAAAWAVVVLPPPGACATPLQTPSSSLPRPALQQQHPQLPPDKLDPKLELQIWIVQGFDPCEIRGGPPSPSRVSDAA